ALDSLQRLIVIERLGQIFEGAVLNGTNRSVEIPEGRDGNDRRATGNLPQPGQSRKAVHTRQPYVHDDDVRYLLGRECQSFFGRSGGGDAKAVAGQAALERPANRLFIIDDQHVRSRGRHDFSSRELRIFSPLGKGGFRGVGGRQNPPWPAF